MIPIAKEVRFFLIAIGVILIFTSYKLGLQSLWIPWLVYLALLFLFRDFSRQVPSQPLAIISPVDGNVIHIEEAYDPYMHRVAKCIHIRQSPFGEFNVHSPVEGNVQNLWVISPTEPEYPQLAMWIKTDEDDDAVLAANLKSIFRHATCSISTGDRLGQGQRCGFMAFACKLTIYLPTSANITIKAGQSVSAGSDKLAEFVHESSP